MNEIMTKFFRDEEGANMVEYALLVALVGVLLIGVVYALTEGVGKTINTAITTMGGTPGTVGTKPGG